MRSSLDDESSGRAPDHPIASPASLVAEAMRDATRRAGKQLALATQLEARLGRSYSDKTVSSWNRGSVMPPADVLVAAAQATGMSLDEKLGIGQEPSEVEQELAGLRKDVDEQAKSLAFLYRRLEDAGITLNAEPADRGNAQGATG